MEACLGKTAMDLEANPEEKKSVVVHEEVPKEEAAVETFGALKEKYRDRHIAVRHRGQPRKRNQGYCGSRNKLATACRRMTCHAIPVRRKEYGHQGEGQDSVARGAPKGRTFWKKRRAQPECDNGIKDRGS
jgi:hypothetical protein